jgi:hypothetical protein
MQHDETQPGCITIIILAAKIDKRNEACCRRGDISCIITTGHPKLLQRNHNTVRNIAAAQAF